MAMANNPNLVDIKNMTETDRFLIVYQGWRDTWSDLDNHKKEEKEERDSIKADVKTLTKLVITGDGDMPSHSEMLRSHEKFINTIGKLAWIIVSAVIVQVVSFIGVALWMVARLYPLLNK